MRPLFLLCTCVLSLSLAAQPAFQVRKEGSGGKAIVFIPGFGCSGDVWKETLKDYTSDYTCYILTMPGFAGTKPEADPNFQNWVAEVAGFIREQKIVKPIVIGHSLGGGIALLLASRYPDLVDRIVVVDALPCLSAIMNPSFKSEANPDCSQFSARFTQMDDAGFSQMEQRAMKGLMADTAHRAEAIHWVMQSDRRTLGQIFCQYSNLDMRDSLGSIACPALVLLEAPFAGMKEGVEAQYRGLHAGSLVYATKGLHFIMFDDQQWYRDQLAHFIKK